MSLKSVLSSKSIQDIANISKRLPKDNNESYDSTDINSISNYANECMIESKETVDKMVSLIGSFTYEMGLGTTCFDFYKYLIDNPEAKDKIRFISDGSFYEVRVWTYVCSERESDLNIVVDLPNDGYHCNSAHKYSVTEALQYIYENYEYIPVQIPMRVFEDINIFNDYVDMECYLRQSYDYEPDFD